MRRKKKGNNTSLVRLQELRIFKKIWWVVLSMIVCGCWKGSFRNNFSNWRWNRRFTGLNALTKSGSLLEIRTLNFSKSRQLLGKEKILFEKLWIKTESGMGTKMVSCRSFQMNFSGDSGRTQMSALTKLFRYSGHLKLRKWIAYSWSYRGWRSSSSQTNWTFKSPGTR